MISFKSLDKISILEKISTTDDRLWFDLILNRVNSFSRNAVDESLSNPRLSYNLNLMNLNKRKCCLIKLLIIGVKYYNDIANYRFTLKIIFIWNKIVQLIY